MSSNEYRKCAKCGKTRVDDPSVTYHRFPNPGTSNVIKARAWAEYCWPQEDWTHASLLSLHLKNRVLCGRHFSSSQFYDNKRQKLSKFAIPDSHEVKKLLSDRENVFNQNVQNLDDEPSVMLLVSKDTAAPKLSTNEPIYTKQMSIQTPLLDIESYASQPSTSGMISGQQAFGNVVPILENPCKEQHTLPEMAATVMKSKKHRGILSAINVTKTSCLTTREKKLHNISRKYMKEIIRLRKKLKSKKINPVQFLYENENVNKLCSLNITNSFIVLLQSQLKNAPKKPKGRRYTLEQKIIALVIYKKSPACYRLLRRMFSLPCQSSLNKLLNKVPLKPGINNHIFKSLKEMSRKQSDEDNICILSFDEMSIRKHLHYDMKQDEIQGFQDHGNHGRSPAIASKALVFMLAGIRKKWKQPIAFYFSNTITADRMTVIVKEILAESFNANLNVVATVCDMSTVNVRVLKTLGATKQEPFFSFNGKEIVSLFDPPHLLKCTRNMLMKHNVECTTEIQGNDKTIRGIAKWSHLETFYKLDKMNTIFVYAPQLTDSHLCPNIKQKMKVSLAAQVFSSGVTAGLLAKIASNELPAEVHATATFTKKFDQIFDALNADSPDARRGKNFSTNITNRSPHLKLFVEMRKFISEMIYVGARSKPPSQDGWIHTINGIERLWKNLQVFEIKSLATRRLNQDPLENCFGCIRYNCGSNNNPTTQQFIAGIKTAIISNLKYSGQRKNCEDDAAYLCDNLTSFLKADDVDPRDLDSHYVELKEVEGVLADAVETVELTTPEGQACAYVCAFIYKNMQQNECPNCRTALLVSDPETIHIFTCFKEFSNTQSLNYINKNMIQCVQTIALIIYKYLNAEAWQPQIKNNIIKVLEIIDFDFLNKCMDHFEINKRKIIISTFFIAIKRHIVLKNREFDEDERNKALLRKIQIVTNK